MTSEHALYAIEDILGGHCAVANFAVRALIDVATRPRVQAGVRAELAAVLGEGGQFGLEDKSRLSYLQVLSTEYCTDVLSTLEEFKILEDFIASSRY